MPIDDELLEIDARAAAEADAFLARCRDEVAPRRRTSTWKSWGCGCGCGLIAFLSYVLVVGLLLKGIRQAYSF